MRMFSYIDNYSQEAVEQMVHYRIPASVTLAQAIFESGSGSSELCKKSNNHFGIKCHNFWSGDTVSKTDDLLNECFRKYRSIHESYTDHSLFLQSRPWYKPLFQLPLTDYKGWCRGLKSAGYATYPGYADELIRIIEQNRLWELDGCEKMDLKSGLVPAHEEIVTSGCRTASFSLREFTVCGLLWLEEKNIHVRSLDLIVENGEDAFYMAEK
jgi:flagellum-specific peptidoglycan hydrolase FlgJ